MLLSSEGDSVLRAGSLQGQVAEPSFRVLAATNMYPTSADPNYGNFVASQMSSLEALGLKVTVEFVDGRRSEWEYARAIWRVRQLASSGKFDLVHAHYGLTGFVAAFQSLPLVVSFCGDDLLGTPDGRGGVTWKSRLGVRLSHWAARRADGIICKSEELRTVLPRSADRVRAHVIGNGVDTARFKPGDRQRARERLRMEPTERLVLFPHSRRQQAVKRFDLAEAAVARLQRGGSTVRLWVVNGVTPEQMPNYYHAADCLLLTSDHEGSSNAVKEALCCDLPVVSVAAGDAPDWIALVPGCRLVARDPEAIAGGLRQVLANPDRVDGATVRERLALNAVARRILSVYQEALGRQAS